MAVRPALGSTPAAPPLFYFALENLVLWASGSASLRGVGPTSRRPARRAYKPEGRAYASESQDSLLELIKSLDKKHVRKMNIV
jgi:hypothetical protein